MVWTFPMIADFVGSEKGTVRRWHLRGRLSGDLINWQPRKTHRFADTPEFRAQLEALRDYHARPSKVWQAATTSRRGRIAKLATICRGELATDKEDRLAAGAVMRALVVLWERQVEGRDCPALRGALDMGPVVRARGRLGDERLFAQLAQAAGMLERSKENTLPEK